MKGRGWATRRVGAGLGVLVLIAAVAGCAAKPTLGTEVGELAPDFALSDTSGRILSLEEYRGNPVVLVFYRGKF